MKCSHHREYVSRLLVRDFLLENFRPGNGTHFRDGLLDSFGTVSSGYKMHLQVPGMGGKVRVFGANAAESESLAVCDARFAVTGMAA